MREEHKMNDANQTMLAAYSELVEDTTTLRDVGREGYAQSAVHVSLERTGFSTFEVNVGLHQIEGSQLASVLAVARKYELEAREENGWLTLRRHYTDSDMETESEHDAAAA